jgi:hypothetical protein
MRTLKVFFLIPMFFLIPALCYSSNLEYMRTSLLDGDVQIKTQDSDDWVPASINMPLEEGDQLWVPEGGRAELEFRDGTQLRLGQESALEILNLDRDSFQFYLTEGRAYANFKGSRDSLLQIDTPQSSVRAYDSSRFNVDVSRDGRTDISVYRGSVYAESQDGKTRVEEGKTLTVGGGDYAELAPLGPMDNWENWNRDRDRRLAEARPPSRYLPDELHTYSRDFDDNGRWDYVRDYGYVWRPTVVVSAGWAPYRQGRWTWIGGDYVWVSYEPWGWAPYHYGRWAFVVNFGWCWVPPVRGAVFWGPGYVGWVYTPTYVAWVPLAPREIYYGHGYYGPHSVNITNVNVTNINVTNVTYKNVHVHNAVTVVNHDAFAKGRKYVHVDAKENPFVGRKVHVGRPDIKPEKGSRMPVIKEIPENRRPPQAVRQVHVKELKQQRPMVKERDASVMRPASAPKDMKIRTIDRKPVERPKDVAPVEKRVQQPKETRPQERTTPKPRETKPPERKTPKPKETKPPERATPQPRETKPPERVTPKPTETKPPERVTPKPKETKPPERATPQPRETKPPERVTPKPTETRPQERTTPAPRETKPPERVTPQPKETRPQEKNTDNPRETRPPDKSSLERPKENRSADKGIKASKESQPASRVNVTRVPETQPAKAVERPSEMRQTSKGNGKGVESRPSQKPAVRQKGVQSREKNAERI